MSTYATSTSTARLAGFLDSVDTGIVCETDLKEEFEQEMRSAYGPGSNDF